MRSVNPLHQAEGCEDVQKTGRRAESPHCRENKPKPTQWRSTICHVNHMINMTKLR